MGTTKLDRGVALSAHFHVSPDTLSKAYPNEQIALVHLKTRRIQILNRTASLVWKLLAAGSSRGEMQEIFNQEFNGDKKQVSKDVDAILSRLEGEGLISIEESAG